MANADETGAFPARVLTEFLFRSYLPPWNETLATYPLVSVRIACRNCKRRGSYRLARLAERFGADATLDEVLTRITVDCNLASNRTGRPGCRAAYFQDLECPQQRPDQPGARMPRPDISADEAPPKWSLHKLR